MIYWLLIILGIIILSLSLSNPVFSILNRYIKLSLLFQVFARIVLLVIGILIIIFGLYIESII